MTDIATEVGGSGKIDPLDTVGLPLVTKFPNVRVTNFSYIIVSKIIKIDWCRVDKVIAKINRLPFSARPLHLASLSILFS